MSEAETLTTEVTSVLGYSIKAIVEKGNKGDHLLITEAMKMETTVQAPFTGIIKDSFVKSGEAIQTGDLLIEIAKVEANDLIVH